MKQMMTSHHDGIFLFAEKNINFIRKSFFNFLKKPPQKFLVGGRGDLQRTTYKINIISAPGDLQLSC